MKEWTVSPDGVLGVSDGSKWFPVAAEHAYRALVEKVSAGPNYPSEPNGAAIDLRFSPYPVAAVLVVHFEDTGRPVIGFEARTQTGRTFPLSADSIRHGHSVCDGVWRPISSTDSSEIRKLLSVIGLDLGAPAPSSLRQHLELRRAAADGLPVEIRLPDDAMLDVSQPDEDCVPEGITATLYPYQLHGWRWLRFVVAENVGGLLADEMGLGKTLQIISVLRDPVATEASAMSLVIAPSSLLENWAREIRKFSTGLRPIKHHGADRTGSPNALRRANVVITSYETAVRDLPLLRMIDWRVVVVDEAQNIRNPDTRRAKAIKQLRRQTSLAVTGTPVENRLRDLWSIMDFVLPDYLGGLADFESRYGEDENGATSLEPLISPLMIRRRIKDVAQDLPPRIDIPDILELDQEEAVEYEAVRTAVCREYGTGANFVALTRLRQFCSHPALLHQGEWLPDFSKLQRLTTLLAEIFERGEKVLIFTAFTGMADRIVDMARNKFAVLAETLDGRLPISDRQPLIDQFSAYPGAAGLVLNPRAGGAGLNLAAANHVIQYNPEWNPAIEDQASARAHRRGQERPVTVRRLIFAGTVEEVMDERLQRKRAIARHAIKGTRGDSEDYADILAALTRSPLSRPVQHDPSIHQENA